MKPTRTRLALLVFMLAFAVQLAFILPTARAAQNTNSSTTMSENQNMGSPISSRCRRRCTNAYRMCLHHGKNRKACLRQYRNCLRRCPQ